MSLQADFKIFKLKIWRDQRGSKIKQGLFSSQEHGISLFEFFLNFQFSFHLETSLDEAGLIYCDAYRFFILPSFGKGSLIDEFIEN